MRSNQVFKSERHLRLAMEDQVTARQESARAIARAFARPTVPRTRSQSSHWLVRCIRAILRFL